MTVQVTVAICTYDRAASLERTLSSLREQGGVANLQWELLIVDNNSSDSTEDVVRAAAADLPVRYVKEGRQGLSHARNRALVEYRGQVLLFTDDDVVLDPHWLRAYADAFDTHAHAAYFGGRILPLWDGERPRWVRDEGMALISGVLVHYDLGTEDRWYARSDPLPFGASFALRRSQVERLGQFRPDLGVVGHVPGRGEETTYLGKAAAAGARGFYVGKALARHAVDRRRLRPARLFRHGIQSGVAVARTQVVERPGSYAAMLLFLAKALVQLAKRRGDRARQCLINAGIQVGLRQAGGGSAL
jgi:GT2 family glycosyltransferase